MATPVIRWYANSVKALIESQTQEGLALVAQVVKRQAERDLLANGQHDTGFLYDSLYVATPDSVTSIAPSGEYVSRRSGRMVARQSAPITRPTKGVHVGAAAEYAIYPELANSYLYRAVEQVTGQPVEAAMASVRLPGNTGT